MLFWRQKVAKHQVFGCKVADFLRRDAEEILEWVTWRLLFLPPQWAALLFVVSVEESRRRRDAPSSRLRSLLRFHRPRPSTGRRLTVFTALTAFLCDSVQCLSALISATREFGMHVVFGGDFNAWLPITAVVIARNKRSDHHKAEPSMAPLSLLSLQLHCIHVIITYREV